jgi:hypothetical protein
MFVPSQAPPVERSLMPQQANKSDGIQAQVTCICYNGTWWCIAGRDLVNSNVPC